MTCSDAELIEKLQKRNAILSAKCSSLNTIAREYQKKLDQICRMLGVRPWGRGERPCGNCGAKFTFSDPCVCQGDRKLNDPVNRRIAVSTIGVLINETRTRLNEKRE
jgi:hypothetical protein